MLRCSHTSSTTFHVFVLVSTHDSLFHVCVISFDASRVIVFSPTVTRRHATCTGCQQVSGVSYSTYLAFCCGLGDILHPSHLRESLVVKAITGDSPNIFRSIAFFVTTRPYFHSPCKILVPFREFVVVHIVLTNAINSENKIPDAKIPKNIAEQTFIIPVITKTRLHSAGEP